MDGMKFRKIPVVLEAWQWNGVFQYEPDWLYKALSARTITANPDASLCIKTLEGDHRADIGDWIIQGIKGELYPCKPDIFEALYEAITPSP